MILLRRACHAASILTLFATAGWSQTAPPRANAPIDGSDADPRLGQSTQDSQRPAQPSIQITVQSPQIPESERQREDDYRQREVKAQELVGRLTSQLVYVGWAQILAGVLGFVAATAAALAAHKSASAAQQSAHAAIGLIELDSPLLHLRDDKDNWAGKYSTWLTLEDAQPVTGPMPFSISCVFHNYGRSAAILTEIQAALSFTDTDAPPILSSAPELDLPKHLVIGSEMDTEPVTVTAVTSVDEFRDTVIRAVRHQGPMSVQIHCWLYGIVKYRSRGRNTTEYETEFLWHSASSDTHVSFRQYSRIPQRNCRFSKPMDPGVRTFSKPFPL